MSNNEEWPCWNVNHMKADNHEIDSMSCGPICPKCSDLSGEEFLRCSSCQGEIVIFHDDECPQAGPECCDDGDIEVGVRPEETFAVLWTYQLRTHSDARPQIQYRLRCPECGYELERLNKKGESTTWNVSHKDVTKAQELFYASYNEYVMHEFEAGNKPVRKSDYLNPEAAQRIQVASDGPECAHLLCDRTDTELHHFMPVSFADQLPDGDDPENWPKAWLCVEHHRFQWHAIVTPQFAIHG